MVYLTGAVVVDMPRRPDLGVMLKPAMGNAPSRWLDRPHALDNGCFAQGERFDQVAWLSWLESVRRWQSSCLFAVAPDVVGDAEATWRRSRDVLPVIRNLGYPAAFVAQDGQESRPVPWEAFDVLFVGGSTAWKLSEHAYRLMAEAGARGKWVHAGRVNSFRRIVAMVAAGADSVDGTFVAFGPDRNLPRVLGWLDRVRIQPALMAPPNGGIL